MKNVIDSLEQVIAQADPSACPELLGELERLKALLWAKLARPEASSQVPILSPENGRYLTVEEVVIRFGVTDRWLYRHKKQMPYSQPSRKVLLFPEGAITKWFVSRNGP